MHRKHRTRHDTVMGGQEKFNRRVIIQVDFLTQRRHSRNKKRGCGKLWRSNILIGFANRMEFYMVRKKVGVVRTTYAYQEVK